MKKTSILLLIALMLPVSACCDKTADNRLPEWQEGWLDIHHISTGRGNAALIIMPDGTNMLVDCGDNAISQATEHNEVQPIHPNDSKHPAEWIKEYFKMFAPAKLNNESLDYAMITHYHADHMGAVNEPFAFQAEGYSFIESGITELGCILPITTLINRSDVDDPEMPANYKTFIEEYREPKGLKTEALRVGRNDQIVLLHSPENYPAFEVRNVTASRTVWTGEGTQTEYLGEVHDNENANSCGVCISYGDFDYLTCGDIPGTFPVPNGETPVANAVGECDVVVACHHGFQEAMNPDFCRTLDPQAYVIPVREYWHPSGKAVETMCNESLHSAKPQLYCTGWLESTKKTMEENGYGEYFQPYGHIVIRVKDGGETFRIFVLNDDSEEREIIYASPEFKSK